MKKIILPAILSCVLLACGEDVHSVQDQDTPDVQNPDVQNPDVQNPDVQNPDVQNPDVQNPDGQPPEKPDPDLPDIDTIPFTVDTVDLPGGTFTDRDGNQVQIKPFRMMQTEVSVGWFWACLNRGKCVNKDIMTGGGDQFFLTGEYSLDTDQQIIDDSRLPVHHVRHIGAEHFCKWVGGRLPTEAEWEYAALYDGEKVRDVTYPWGNDAPQFSVNANYQTGNRYQWCRSSEDLIELPQSAYTYDYHFMLINMLPKGRTPTGLYNMAGNVMEYVAEYDEDYPVPNGVRAECNRYILKGGSADSSPDKLAIREREYFQQCYNETWAVSDEERALIHNGELAGVRCVFDE